MCRALSVTLCSASFNAGWIAIYQELGSVIVLELSSLKDIKVQTGRIDSGIYCLQRWGVYSVFWDLCVFGFFNFVWLVWFVCFPRKNSSLSVATFIQTLETCHSSWKVMMYICSAYSQTYSRWQDFRSPIGSSPDKLLPVLSGFGLLLHMY